ncbi:MAG: hypothetical protein R3F31_05940 [Verrucomicrobiales bacterium]
MRPLPGSSLLVSRLGLGTVKFGRNEQVKYPEPFDLPTDSEILHLLETARECGINLLDTAPPTAAVRSASASCSEHAGTTG